MSGEGKGMFAEERRRRIVELVHARRKIVIPELCGVFGVSASTIRNDLRELQEEGKITRTHGGAIINSKSGFEPLPLDKETQHLERKRAIGCRAAALVEDGDIIAIGTGTTTLELARCLNPELELTVIVNDIHIAACLERMNRYRVILLGGTLRNRFHYTQSNPNDGTLAELNIDKAFISCNGIDVNRGVTTPDPALAHDIQRVVAASAAVYVLCDSSKFGAVTFSRIIGVSEVTRVVTDSGMDEEDTALFRNAGVDLLIARPGEQPCEPSKNKS